MFDNPASYPELQSQGLSPFLMRSPFAGHLLEALECMRANNVMTAWETVRTEQPAVVQRLLFGFLLHLGNLWLLFVDWAEVPDQNLHCQLTCPRLCPAHSDILLLLPVTALREWLPDALQKWSRNLRDWFSAHAIRHPKWQSEVFHKALPSDFQGAKRKPAPWSESPPPSKVQKPGKSVKEEHERLPAGFA